MVGADAGETIQGFAVAMKAGATKAVFDRDAGHSPDRRRGVRDDAHADGGIMIGFAFCTPLSWLHRLPSPSSSSSLLFARRPGGASRGACRREGSGPRRQRPAAKPDAILTPAQLQECVNQKERLQAQTDDALKDKAAIEADKAEIARIGTSLAEERATVDRTSEAAVDAYNAKVEQRDKLIATYQSRVTAYNLKAEAVKATKDGYENPARTAATTSAT
jgi:hypothetical protein